MTLQDAISHLEAVKPGDTRALSDTVRHCEDRADTWTSTEWAAWRDQVRRHSERVYSVAGIA